MLVTRDRVWRAEQHPDGWRLTLHGGLVLSRASLDRLATTLLEHGVNVEDLVED